LHQWAMGHDQVVGGEQVAQRVLHRARSVTAVRRMSSPVSSPSSGSPQRPQVRQMPAEDRPKVVNGIFRSGLSPAPVFPQDSASSAGPPGSQASPASR
jgi:hypothetical protein